jgi:hypothetical protein
VIRIGSAGTHSRFFAAGVVGVTTGEAAIPVLIDGNGQLGTTSSSRRFKENIEDMGEASSALLQLRPVTFRYRQAQNDGSKPPEYGLIAEEVAEVFPDLVVRDAGGRVETIQYQKLTPLLLNEVLKQNRHILRQDEAIRVLQAELEALKARTTSTPIQ